jgi:hypothetical protein
LNRFILPKEPEGYKGERSARPSASQKGIRKTPGAAPLPNLAVYENQERRRPQDTPIKTDHMARRPAQRTAICLAAIAQLPGSLP